MAKATLGFDYITKTVMVEQVIDEQVDAFYLNLTPEEAGALLDILYKIGGSPTRSGRKHADSIFDALLKAGAERAQNPATGSINFLDDGSE